VSWMVVETELGCMVLVEEEVFESHGSDIRLEMISNCKPRQTRSTRIYISISGKKVMTPVSPLSTS
jgi:hypothetical protein